jgi:citrate lyase subunit beta/citryl-CoA lyase
MMEKAAGSEADQVFLDLEDACAPSEKKAARALAVEALNTHDFGAKVRAVRVNDVTTRWCYMDVIEVVTGAGSHVDALVIPKVEDATHVLFIDHLLHQLETDLERASPIELEVQIESSRGAINLHEIVNASDRIATVIFGPGDYAASLGVAQIDIGMNDDRYPGHQWHWVMSEIANHARAIGAQAIDGPYGDFHDEQGYSESALRAKLLGFEGKWCIHPNQIPWANHAFSPSVAELDAAAKIVAAYERATTEGVGAIAVDGKLVDEASRKAAEGILARGGGILG